MSALSFLKKSRATSKVSKRGADDGVEKMFEKMSLGDSKKTGVSVPKSKQASVPKSKSGAIRFTHSIYGMMIRGVHKGYEVEVVKYYPDMYEILLDNKILFVKESDFKRVGKNKAVLLTGLFDRRTGKLLGKRAGRLGIVLNDKNITIDPKDLLYKDLLLNDDTYAQVNSVTMEGNEYIYMCTILGKSKISVKRRVTQKDIKQVMSGFSIQYSDVKSQQSLARRREEKGWVTLNTNQGLDEDEYEVDNQVTDESDDESQDSIDYEDEPEDAVELELTGDQYEDKMERSYGDFTRVHPTDELSQLQKKYIKMVGDTLKHVGYSEDHIRSTYGLVDDIIHVMNSLKAKITKSDINFDLERSVDAKIIVACMIFRDTIRNGTLQDTLNDYINRLIKSKHIGSVNTSIVFSIKGKEIVPCDVKREELANIIRTIMLCYNSIIGDLLDANVNIETNIKYEPEYIKPERKSKEVKNFVTINDIKSGKDFSHARNIVWGPYYKERLDMWLEGEGKDEPDFIKTNIQKAPIVINDMWEEMIALLRHISGFSERYDSCMDPVCRNVVVTEYINELPDIQDEQVTRLKLFGRLADTFRMLVRD